MFKKLIILCLTLVVFLLPIGNVFYTRAADDQLEFVDVGAIPGSKAYIFKRLKEKILITLTFSKAKKSQYLENLLNIRLVELGRVAKNYDIGSVGQTSNRYSYYAGKLAEASRNLDTPRRESIKNTFSLHLGFLETYRDIFPANSAYWLYLQQNIDTLRILSSEEL